MRVDYSLGNVLCFNFTLTGAMLYHTSGKDIVQEQGTNTIWSVREPHTGTLMLKKNKPISYFGISLCERHLESLTEKYPDMLTDFFKQYKTGDFLVKKRPFGRDINRIILQIKNSYLMGDLSGMYVDSKITELLALYLSDRYNDNMHQCNQCCKNRKDVDRIYEARQILLSNLDCPPSIIELSHQVGINDFKLKKGFKEIFNQTVYGCLFNHKMEMAHNLLYDTERSIKDIAETCGYEHASHFSKAFKRKFGLSPLAYRQEIVECPH